MSFWEKCEAKNFMKSRAEIKSELERQYLHRLQLRIERKMKNFCRNCKNSQKVSVDLGEFGEQSKYVCKDGLQNPESKCEKFECIYNQTIIERELLDDIKDPSVCGAKEPKIAALLWVLHDENLSVLEKVKKFFKS